MSSTYQPIQEGGVLVGYENFIGGTYTTRSIMGDCERSVNLYSETIKTGAGKNTQVLYRTPGKQLFCTFPTFPVQAEYELNGRAWAASGNVVYEVFSNGTFIARGNITPCPAGQYVTIVGNSGNQLAICSSPNLFILNTSTNVLTQTPSGFSEGLLGAQTVTMVDGYFVANAPNTPTFSTSNFNDGTTFQGINQQSTEDYPDNLYAVANFNHYLMLFGENRSEVYYNTGSNSAIFARYEGSYQYQGTEAPWSIAYADNTIFYLGKSFTGGGVVYRLEGFSPKRVSDYSFETAIQQYPTLTDAVAYTYQEGGHFFYVIHFPSANGGLGATWVYDINEQKWHERGYWNYQTGQYQADIGRFHMYAFGMHLVGDYQTGNLYQQSLSFPADNGNNIRWLRRAPHVYKQNVRIFYRQLILDMQIGTAQQSGQGSDPQVGLVYSDDGGQTFQNERITGMGKLGVYRKRVTWNQLGFARDRVFEVFGSDPTPALCIVNAYLFIEIGNS